ncbi:MAG: nitrilase-related carbon-nitrogen hydrolase, partial [Armatimonadota bacterium]
MSTEIRVAGAQMPVTTEIESNVETICRAIDFAASEKAEILLTPEGSLSGYTSEFDAGAAREGLERVTAKAREAGVGLALGTCFADPEDGKRYNQIRFYGLGGECLGFHSKTLLCG